MSRDSSSIEAGAAPPFLSGVILAAGASTRMGQLKQLLPLGERPLLEWVLREVAGSRLDEIVLVLGHAAEEIQRRVRLPETERPCRVVVNHDHARGQSGSLTLGLGATDSRAVAAAILLGDQPGVTRALIDRVASAFLDAGLPAARPVYDDGARGRVPGHPVFLARRLWGHVEALRGYEGARALLAAHPEWLLEVPVGGPAPVDVDTWRDYEACRQRQRLGMGAPFATSASHGCDAPRPDDGAAEGIDGGERSE